MDAWSSEPVYTLDDLRGTYRTGYNVGVRLGEPSRVGGYFLYVLDMDVRIARRAGEAKAALRTLLPDYESLPFVISGSGGESRHFYLLSDGLFRSKKVAHSEDKFTDARGTKHWAWEIELFGTGKQVALPPSIHPDTGQPYRWGRELDFDLLEMGVGPIVSAERIKGWFPEHDLSVNETDDDDEDLGAYLHKQPMGLSKSEIERTLADLPLNDWCEDRDGWLNVGMALHHEFQGSAEGLATWNAFSKRSSKFNEKDQKRVWNSFKVTAKSLRFAALIKAAADARMKADLLGDGLDSDDDLLGGADDDDDLLGDFGDGDDDLLGAPAAPAEKSEVDWVSKLDRNEVGAVKPTLHNLELIVRYDPRTTEIIGLNLFTMEVVLRRKPSLKVLRRPSPKGSVQLTGRVWDIRDPVNGDLWSDAMDDAVRAMIEAPTRQGGYGIKVPDRDLRSAVNNVAQKNAFHPVREYLESLRWDGVRRLDTLFIRFLGAPDNPYTRSVARLTLIGGVARVMRPGHKFDFATILEGLQGRRKSTFIKVLARSWFSELDGDFHDSKQMVESMQGSWVLEIPELSGFSRSDVRQIKAFISRTTDKVRLAYARRAAAYHRQCIFIGSTNDREYLRDDTGGRRFWPVECTVGSIDTEALELEIDQVWAEAKAEYDEMRAAKPHGDLPLYLTDATAHETAIALQEDRRVETAEDAMAGRIAAWLGEGSGFDEDEDLVEADKVCGRTETCLAELWVECFGRDLSTYGQIQAQQLGRAMKKVEGWRTLGSRKRVEKYGLQRIYWKQPA